MDILIILTMSYSKELRTGLQKIIFNIVWAAYSAGYFIIDNILKI